MIKRIRVVRVIRVIRVLRVIRVIRVIRVLRVLRVLPESELANDHSAPHIGRITYSDLHAHIYSYIPDSQAPSPVLRDSEAHSYLDR